jgi:hypothetical protein
MDEKLSEIDRRIQQLTALRNELASMVDASPRRGPGSNCKVCQSFEVSGC